MIHKVLIFFQERSEKKAIPSIVLQILKDLKKHDLAEKLEAKLNERS